MSVCGIFIPHSLPFPPSPFLHPPPRPYPDIFNLIEPVENTDVLVINVGLHFRAPFQDLYARVVMGVLTLLRPYAHNKLIIWRETSAQHHNSDGGEWPPGMLKAGGWRWVITNR